MTVSFDSKRDIGKVIFLVRQAVENSGFKINKKKTKIQNIFNGRIIITGVGIDLKGVHPTRKTRKKLRAAYHQEKDKNSIQGLEEWCKCKLPRMPDERKIEAEPIGVYSNSFNEAKVFAKKNPLSYVVSRNPKGNGFIAKEK